MNAPGILWRTPPVHISVERHLKSPSLVWSRLFLLSGSPEVVWWWLLLTKRQCWALSLTESSVVSSSSHLCLVSLSLGNFFGLPDSCPSASAWSWHIWWCWSFGCVSSISKDGCDIITPKLSIIFRGLIRRGSFPECWLSANVTAIPKGAPSPDRENYHSISITPILSKVYEKLVFHKLSIFREKYGIFPATQFTDRKGLGCTDALLTVSHRLQKSLDTEMESSIEWFTVVSHWLTTVGSFHYCHYCN